MTLLRKSTGHLYGGMRLPDEIYGLVIGWKRASRVNIVSMPDITLFCENDELRCKAERRRVF